MPASDRFGDLIIVIPGILGSRLVRPGPKGDETVWDLSLRTLPGVLKKATTGGLALSSSHGKPNDGIVARELFRDQLMPGFFGVDDYRPLLAALSAVVPTPAQLRTFPYDWRGSNRHAAQALADFALPALHDWSRSSGNTEARLWLVCHSMGGLVARYFCEHLGGAAVTRELVSFGTPYRGAMKALDKLVNGLPLAGGLVDLSATVRSLPSAYELLPLYPAVRVAGPADQAVMHSVADFFDLDRRTGAPTERRSGLAPLPHLDPRAIRDALEFHACIRVPAEARQAAGVPSPYRLRAFINNRQVTATAGYWRDGRLAVLDTLAQATHGAVWQQDLRGDGTVPSFAALPIEWDDSAQAIALPGKHAAAHTDQAGLDSLVNWLRPMDVRALRGGTPAPGKIVALQVPAALRTDDRLVVRVSSGEPVGMKIAIADVATGIPRSRPAQTEGGDTVAEVDFGRLTEGTWQVTVQPVDRLLPRISDHVVVIGD